jgi:hypothetical protein
LANTPRPRKLDGLSARARPAEKRGGGEAGWAERPDGPAGRWAESEGKILFRIKFDFFDYSKALKNCRRFRRNFDMRIFPKIF